MKATLKRKYIYLDEKPTENNGKELWFEIEPKGEASLPYYYTEILKGKTKYRIPEEVLREKTKIMRVFFKKNGKEL